MLYPAKVKSAPLWTPEFISPTAWYDASDESTITRLGTAKRCRLGLIDFTSGTNPYTGVAWQVGDPYRIIFVTKGLYDALSSDLTTYDAIVQAEAEAAGLGEITWKAIVSKSGEDARDRTGSRIGVDYDGPIYRPDGTLICEKLSRLWSGSSGQLNVKPTYTAKSLEQSLSNLTLVFTNWTAVWTGTSPIGTYDGAGMGDSSVNFGILAAEDRYWCDRGDSSAKDSGACLYGMSPVLYVTEADLVSQINDKVGTNHLTQTTEASRAAIGVRKVNGKNCLDFIGDDNDYDFTTGIGMLNKMAFMVLASDKYSQQQVENNGNAVQTRLQDTTGDDGREIFFAGSDQTTDYGAGPTTSQAMSQFYASIPHIMGWSYSDPLDVYRDGRVEHVRTRVASTGPITTIRFGNYSTDTAPLDGALCEYIITPVLSTEDRLRMEGYLAHKWGCTSRLPATHPYKTLPPRMGNPVVDGSWTPDQTDLLTWLEFAWDENNLLNDSDNNFDWVGDITAPDQINLESQEGDRTSRFPKGAIVKIEGAANAANRLDVEVESSTYGTVYSAGIDEFDSATNRIYFDVGEGDIRYKFGNGGGSLIVTGAAQPGNNTTWALTGTPGYTGGRTYVTVTGGTVTDEGPGSAASGAIQATAITTVETTLVTEINGAQLKTVRVTALYNKKGRDAENYGIAVNSGDSKGSVRDNLLNSLRGYDNEHGGYYNPSLSIPASGDFGMLMVVKIKDIDNSGQDLRSSTGGTEGYALQPNNAAQFDGRIATTSNGNVDFTSTPISDGSFHLLGVRFDYTGAGKFTGRLDGDVDTTEGTYSTKLDGTGGRFLSGPTGTQHPHVIICEMVEFEDVSTAFYEKMEGYLAWKWGLEGSLPVGHTYKSAPPRVDQ